MKAIAFDFDGTFINTELTYFESWRSVFADFSVPFSLDLWVRTLWTYPQRITPIAYLENLQLADFDKPRVEAVRKERELALACRLELRPGIAKVLGWCDTARLQVGIVTGSSRHWVFSHLGRLGVEAQIGCVVTKEDTTAFKPFPDPYLKFAEKTGRARTEIIAIEDTPIGIKSAKDAGMVAVAFPNEVTSCLDFRDADALCNAETLLPAIQSYCN